MHENIEDRICILVHVDKTLIFDGANEIKITVPTLYGAGNLPPTSREKYESAPLI